MSDIETRLHELAREIDFPPTPAFAVPAAEVAGRPRRRFHRPVFAAVALAVAALTATLALSDGARSAFLELFRIGGADVIRLDEPPPEAGELVAFGQQVSLAEARRAAGFAIRLPVDTGAPRAVYLDRQAGIVSVVWCCDRRIVLTQFSASYPGLIEKTLGPSSRIDRFILDGARALWIVGGEHVIRVIRPGSVVERPVGVRGSVLLWERAKITYRLEGELDRTEAVKIARSLR
jgi:hypothetical protein